MDKRVRVIYSGKVQGVGFRFTTVSIARNYPITGMVRNLRDRTVELIAEGREEQLSAFLQELQSEFSSMVQNADVTWEESRGGFRGFTVAY